MKKIILLVSSILFFFAFADFSFAAGLTPFEWDKPKNVEEIMGITKQEQDAISTEIKITDISILGFSPEIILPDGSRKKVSSVDDLRNGGEIRMGDGSNMVITFSDGSEVFVGDFSIINFQARLFGEAVSKIEQALKQAENEIVLLQGRIKASIVKNIGRKFTVRTPSAVTSVRGTDFVVEHDATTKITSVYLYEGLVDVDNLHGKITQLVPGDVVTVDGDGKIISRKLEQGEWNKLTSSGDEAVVVKQKSSLGRVFVLIIIIGGGIFFYRRRRIGR